MATDERFNRIVARFRKRREAAPEKLSDTALVAELIDLSDSVADFSLALNQDDLRKRLAACKREALRRLRSK